MLPRRSVLSVLLIVVLFVLGSEAVPFTTAAAEYSVVCTGEYHTCAIRDDRSTVCWGSNEDGQLGLDHDDDDYIGRPDDADGPSELGDALVALDLGTDGDGNYLTAKSLSCGGAHTCAVLSDDTLKCWGYNGYGQLGLDHDEDIGDGSEPKKLRRLQAEMGDALPAVSLGTDSDGNDLTAKSVSCGGAHTCAVLSDDTLKCWGSDLEGELGEKTTFDEDGYRSDYIFGTEPGDMAALGIVNLGTNRTVLNVFLNPESYSSCALLDDYSLKCWGGNAASGKLGNEVAAYTEDYIGDGRKRDEDGNNVVLDEDETEMGDSLIAVNLGTGRTVFKLICLANEYVASNGCTACASGTTNAAGDDASGADTTCDATLCAVNEYVASNVCTACAAGTTNAASDDASGADTTCDATLCAVNEYVASNGCTACAAGTTNAAGDDASGADTTCDATMMPPPPEPPLSPPPVPAEDESSARRATVNALVLCAIAVVLTVMI